MRIGNKGKNHSSKEKVAALLLCAAGLLFIFYGMAKEENVVFIIGLALFIGGYLLVRKGLKRTPQNKE